MLSLIKIYYQYAMIFIGGAVVLILEIGGARLLAPFYGSTIFVWSSLITVTLGFLALGYFIGGIIVDRWPRIQLFYSVIFLGGLSALILLKLNRILLVWSDQFGFKFGPLVAALALFALPLLFSSMAGPFLIRLRAKSTDRSGHIAGTVFGVSTTGSLAGALLAGFYLIPNYSLANTLFYSVSFVMVLAIGGLLIERARLIIVAGAIALLILSYFMPIIKYSGEGSAKILHQESSFYADLKGVE